MTLRVVAFDLDETLAESKRPITDTMARLLEELLRHYLVAIVSGGKYEILTTHVYARLAEHAPRHNLYLLPTCGAALYEHKEGVLVPVYERRITHEEATIICKAIEDAIDETGVIDREGPCWGERIEHRGSQITLSALGQVAPLEAKKAWDPERIKRPLLREAIAKRLPTYQVKTGGATSFDVTHPGIDKAYGLQQLSAHLGIPIKDMMYVGDALFPGGNDEVVRHTGIHTRETSGPVYTEGIIRELLERVY